MQPVWDWFRWLYENTGINLTIFYDAYDRSRFFDGFLTSLELMASCIALSVIVGIVGAWVQGSRFRALRLVVGGYIQIFRNTPPLIQLYFFYFALGSYITIEIAGGRTVPLVTNFAWAILCLSINAGAFNVEIFRAGIEAVPKTTVEAAEALGYSRLKAYVHVVLPLAFRISFPALINNLVNLIKTTTLAYAIAVPELLYVSSQIWSDNLNVPEMMNVLLIVYVVLVGIFVAVMNRVERAMRVPGIGL